MNCKLKHAAFALLGIAVLASCSKKNDINNGGGAAASGEIKAALPDGLLFGFAVDYNLMANNPAYATTVEKEANLVTFENEMKHASIVQSDGSLNFTTADALYNLCSNAGLQIYGHTLCWYSQQNATYIKQYAGITLPAASELLANPGFESGNSGWSTFNTNGATISYPSDASNAHSGNGYMKVENPTAQTGNQWKVQVSSASFATTPGKKYIISYWVKAASGGGSIRLSTGPSAAQYQGDQTIGASWQQVSWTITATLTATTFLFDMGQVANTYYIDDASVKEVIDAPSGPSIALKVDTAMGQFITGMVTHYKGKVKAWDVVNEPLTDAGTLRTSTNLGGATNGADAFFWSDYLGKDYALKAFKYAAAADPNALLFINDYNLESSNQKLDSLIAYVTYLKGEGAKIDGVGTQMHIGINTAKASIDYMFKKLAATGLKIRISELDVSVNDVLSGFALTPQVLGYQKTTYHDVVASYLQNVPAAQRYGITVWGVDDPHSWRYKSGQDFPLLFDSTFTTKPAYSGVLQALKGQ